MRGSAFTRFWVGETVSSFGTYITWLALHAVATVFATSMVMLAVSPFRAARIEDATR